MDFLSLLYPRRCYFCRQPGAWICDQCWAKANIQTPQKCPICERGSYLGLTHPHCQRRSELDGLLSLFPYQEPWRQLLHDYKYRLVRGLKEIWEQLINGGLTHYQPLVKLWRQRRVAVIPIPLYPARRQWRGFNQAADLAQAVSQQCHLHLAETLLIRKHSTRHQANLPAWQRRRNLTAAAFGLRHKLPAENFLLVDDVVTTGSTFRAAAKLLKQAGAKEVYGFALLG